MPSLELLLICPSLRLQIAPRTVEAYCEKKMVSVCPVCSEPQAKAAMCDAMSRGSVWNRFGVAYLPRNRVDSKIRKRLEDLQWV